MQLSADTCMAAYNSYGLTISNRKTEAMHHPAPGEFYVESNISINGQRINAVNKFTYLGSTLSCNIVIDDEMNTRLTKASTAFVRLNKNVWNRRGIIPSTKIMVYKAVVLSTLHYGCKKVESLPHHQTEITS